MICVGVLLAGCAIRLAPDFDRTVVDGLTKENQKAMVVFATVSSGSSKDTYNDRKSTYNELIGELDALRLQAKSRPIPRPLTAQIFGIGPAMNIAPKNIEKLPNPTPEVIATLVSTVTSMRDTDENSGLTPNVVGGLKREFETSMDQALTYEKALER